MGLTRENPLSLDAVGQLDIDIDKQLGKVALKVETAERARTPWLAKQERFIRQRRGVRKKKNTPWPGASNESWPITEGVIRRWKPAIVNLNIRPEPVALFDAKNPAFLDSAKLAQEFYHWLFSTYMNRTALTTMELADNIGQYGVAYTRQGWDYDTERYSRIVRVDSLFPQGIEPSLQAYNAQIEAANQQSGTQNAPLSPQDFVAITLAQQYGLNLVDPQEQEMLFNATSSILQGARYVRIIYQSILNDKPCWRALNPLDVIRPPRSEAIENDEFITIIHRMTADEIARKAEDGLFRKEAAFYVMERIQGPSWSDRSDTPGGHKQALLSILDNLDGVDDLGMAQVPTAEIWEIYTKLDINGDGLLERVVVWYHHGSKTLLSAFEYPFPFREWPITEFMFEYTSRRPYGARGIAELLSTFQKMTNMLHNSRLDAIKITTAPMFKIRSLGQHFSRNIKFRPGGRIPVTDPADVEPIVWDLRPLLELLREEQMTKTQAEQLIGIFDPSLTQLQGSGRERRTATEIDAVVSMSTEVQSQDAALFQISMAQVHQQLWDLWEEFGPEMIHYRVTGEEQPRLARKSELSGDYDIVPAGSPISTNRALILARARELLQLALQDQSGVLDMREVWLEFLSAHDYQLAKKIARNPQELALLQQVTQVMQQVSKGETK